MQHVAELLRGRDYGDADVHRAATQAASEIMRPGCFNTAVLVLGTVIASFFSE